MTTVRYEEAGDKAVLRTDENDEWLESDSVVRLADWT